MLFLVLCGIKLVLLAELNKHLYQIHWRLSGAPTTWLNHAAFYAFVGIGVWTLVEFGRQCQEAGVKSIRGANAGVVCLGLLFVFLTFHTGDKNYLYPIMEGTLTWGSLIPYLSLDLFFRPPFLAAWLFGYGLVYYVMVRTGREAWAVYLTAICAGAYGLLCLRELAGFRNELLVADCLGIACLAGGRGRGESRGIVFFTLPVLWTVVFWILFRLGASDAEDVPRYFAMLTGSAVVLFGGGLLLSRTRRFLVAWVRFMPLWFFAFLLLANTNYPSSKNYSNLLCLGLASPQYFLGEMGVAVALALCAGLYARLFPKGKLWWLDVLALALIAIAVIDFGLTKTMGQRLEWDVLTFGNSPKMMWKMAKPFLPAVVGGLTAMILLYGSALWVFRRRLEPRLTAVTMRSTGKGVRFALAGFLLLGATGMLISQTDKVRGESAVRFVSSTPLFNRATVRTFTPEEFLQSARDLGMGDPLTTAAAPAASSERLNVVLVFMESSYNKHLSLFGSSEETQPLLSKYKDRMEIFPNFFSNFAGSIHARFATFTSLYPVRDYNAFTLHRVPVKSIFEVLNDDGYTSSLFYSSFFDYTGFGDFLKGRGIDKMYDADTMPVGRDAERVAWGLSESATLGAIRRQIREYASQSDPFFLTYVPAAPHYPYDRIPARFCKYKRLEMDDYKPLYLNELLYMDWVIASIIDELAESGLLDNTLVVITNDHGEMLGGKDGHIGHGWAVTPELANTPLIVMDPREKGFRVNGRVGSQIDLLPTVLSKLGVPPPPDQLYQGRSLYLPQELPYRIAVLDSCSQFGYISGNNLVVGERDSSPGELGALNQRTFTISNRGALARFIEQDPGSLNSFSIHRFEDFQADLLRNYSYYCSVVPKGTNGLAPLVTRASK